MYSILDHNVFIMWKPEYDLGIHIIDEQHRGVVTIINSLYYGIQNEYIEDMLIPIIEMISDYTKIHFQIEEDFLDKCRYPDVTSHCALHAELIAKLAIIGSKSLSEQDPYKFLEFLKKWWIDHIRTEDYVFRDYLLNRQ